MTNQGFALSPISVVASSAGNVFGGYYAVSDHGTFNDLRAYLTANQGSRAELIPLPPGYQLGGVVANGAMAAPSVAQPGNRPAGLVVRGCLDTQYAYAAIFTTSQGFPNGANVPVMVDARAVPQQPVFNGILSLFASTHAVANDWFDKRYPATDRFLTTIAACQFPPVWDPYLLVATMRFLSSRPALSDVFGFLDITAGDFASVASRISFEVEDSYQRIAGHVTSNNAIMNVGIGEQLVKIGALSKTRQTLQPGHLLEILTCVSNSNCIVANCVGSPTAPGAASEATSARIRRADGFEVLSCFDNSVAYGFNVNLQYVDNKTDAMGNPLLSSSRKNGTIKRFDAQSWQSTVNREAALAGITPPTVANIETYMKCSISSTAVNGSDNQVIVPSWICSVNFQGKGNKKKAHVDIAHSSWASVVPLFVTANRLNLVAAPNNANPYVDVNAMYRGANPGTFPSDQLVATTAGAINFPKSTSLATLDFNTSLVCFFAHDRRPTLETGKRQSEINLNVSGLVIAYPHLFSTWTVIEAFNRQGIDFEKIDSYVPNFTTRLNADTALFKQASQDPAAALDPNNQGDSPFFGLYAAFAHIGPLAMNDLAKACGKTSAQDWMAPQEFTTAFEHLMLAKIDLIKTVYPDETIIRRFAVPDGGNAQVLPHGSSVVLPQGSALYFVRFCNGDSLMSTALANCCFHGETDWRQGLMVFTRENSEKINHKSDNLAVFNAACMGKISGGLVFWESLPQFVRDHPSNRFKVQTYMQNGGRSGHVIPRWAAEAASDPKRALDNRSRGIITMVSGRRNF